MDETTKILIGTVSGFIIAFFAEPVKLYFQNKFNLNKMQGALYYEIFHNYMSLLIFLENYSKISDQEAMSLFKSGAKHSIRTECYKHFISNEVKLFYQLKEAAEINLMYSFIYTMKDYIDNDKDSQDDIRTLVKHYTDFVKNSIKEGALNNKIMDKAAGKNTSQKIKKN